MAPERQYSVLTVDYQNDGAANDTALRYCFKEEQNIFIKRTCFGLSVAKRRLVWMCQVEICS